MEGSGDPVLVLAYGSSRASWKFEIANSPARNTACGSMTKQRGHVGGGDRKKSPPGSPQVRKGRARILSKLMVFDESRKPFRNKQLPAQTSIAYETRARSIEVEKRRFELILSSQKASHYSERLFFSHSIGWCALRRRRGGALSMVVCSSSALATTNARIQSTTRKDNHRCDGQTPKYNERRCFSYKNLFTRT